MKGKGNNVVLDVIIPSFLKYKCLKEINEIKAGERVRILILTSNVKGSCVCFCILARSPNHVRVALTKSSSAMNAIKFTAMFATNLIDILAPLEAASIILRSGL